MSRIFSPSRKRACAWMVIASLSMQWTAAYAVSAGYSGFVLQMPGVYAPPPDVNILFTQDDSGSMQSDAIPDLPGDVSGMPTGIKNTYVSSHKDDTTFPAMWKSDSNYRKEAKYHRLSNSIARYLRSSAGNPLYYDPKVTYQPWPKASDDKTLNDPADPSKVNIDPDSPFNDANTVNLKNQLTDSGGNTYYPATYFVYTGTTAMKVGKPDDPNNIASNFIKYEIRSDVPAYPRASTRTDCTGAVGATGCSYTQELQNFANWLQYYRSRFLMAKGGVAAAFAKQGTNMRVGFATINSAVPVMGIRSFSGTNRTAFYDKLYAVADNGSTPLREAMDNVGKYFQRKDIGNPWAEDPTDTTTVGTEYECRRSFHIMSTDGFWNGNDASSPANNNNDSFSGFTPTKPDGTKYAYSNSGSSLTDPLVGRFTISPFKDANSSTLADVAAYYWKTDLRSDLGNRVVPSTRDPAFWQHLTTFTVGLGVNGTGGVQRTSDGSTTVPASEPSTSPFYPFKGQAWLSSNALRDKLVEQKTELTWTTPTHDSQQTGDDLVHAAMNGRGRYFSATNPTDLANGLAGALSEVADQPMDLASLAADSSQLRTGGKVYQATFNPNKWYGRLYAFTQDSITAAVDNKPTDSGYTNATQQWEASNKMPAAADRNIYTSRGATGTGTTFLWASLSSTQQGDLDNDSRIVSYLRGDASLEVANGGPFRDRARYTVAGVTGGVLGDIVNGAPIKGPDAGGGYDRLPSGDPARAAYSTYRTGNVLTNMRNTVFVGANDGMLHAFNIANGIERFAYVPNSVYNVPRSTSGGLAEKKLRMLADPAYTHRFTVDGPPNISDAYVGGWKSVLVASNGAGARGIYAVDVSDPAVAAGGFDASKILWEFSESNSADMGFVLSYPHVARMRDGNWAVIFGNGYDSANGAAKLFIVKLSDGSILREIKVGTGDNNGLSQPNLLLNSNREVVAIYAGDLKGNLWKFDVSSTTASDWAPAFGSAPGYTPLFAAGTSQPISVMPEIASHPSGGAMLVFGTGKLFEPTDTATSYPTNVNLATQTLYGIWDKPGETAPITGAKATILKAQTITSTSASFATTSSNVPDWATQRGWYLDLNSGGERVNISPQIVTAKGLDTVFIVANTPQVAPCTNGGTSRTFGLDPLTGGKRTQPVVFSGGNVLVDGSGVATQPLIQFKASSASEVPQSTTAPTLNNRGQLTSRQGGVELGLPPSSGPCNAFLSYARNDTSILTTGVNLCSGRARISWRQLK